MSFSVNRNTAGMTNIDRTSGQSQNLMDAAVAKARDGLTAQEIGELRQIAESDGNLTGVEQLFLDDITSDAGKSIFEVNTRAADFDASGFEWNVSNTDNGDAQLSVPGVGGRDIVLTFDGEPSGAKQVSGDINQANETLAGLIPDNRQAEWDGIDKHNVGQVRTFLNSLNLSTEDKANFVQAYMTANFNHPGKDIAWNGANLQEGINAVPTDENGRKYLDCEAYCKMAETLMGSDGFTTLGVASGASGDQRDHQVGVLRDGADAYVISNNEVTRVAGGASQSNEQLVQGVYSDFSNVVEDRNGAMRSDTSSYDVGGTLTMDSGQTINITSIDSATTMTGTTTTPSGDNFHVTVTVDEATGDWSSVTALAAGDNFTTNTGVNITMNNNRDGVATFPDGRTQNVRVTVNPTDGQLNITTR